MAQKHLRDVERARKRRDQAERKLVDAMIAAQQSGETYQDIGDAAGYSRQRAHDLVQQRLAELERE